MKRALVSATLAVAVMAGGMLAQGAAQAAPFNARDGAVIAAGYKSYLFGGRNYCWADNGWSGPGWYQCGYAWNNGFGWGGPFGWNGWIGGFAGRGHKGLAGYGHGGFGGGHNGFGGGHGARGHMGGGFGGGHGGGGGRGGHAR